jgi:hypothetical protein
MSGMATEPVQLILVDPNPGLGEAFARHFDGLPNVSVVQGYFEMLPEFDCMVSAANSFGLMDGGVDGAITRFFGEALMRRVQERILDEYLGEQPVGTSIIVETGHAEHPYIAHTPTMRIPMPIARTDHVYSAMWAMLLAVRRHNRESCRDHPYRGVPGTGYSDRPGAVRGGGAADGDGVPQLPPAAGLHHLELRDPAPGTGPPRRRPRPHPRRSAARERDPRVRRRVGDPSGAGTCH